MAAAATAEHGGGVLFKDLLGVDCSELPEGILRLLGVVGWLFGELSLCAGEDLSVAAVPVAKHMLLPTASLLIALCLHCI